jgi:hypothetical protein
MFRRDRTSYVLLGGFLASTLVLLATTITNVVPEYLASVALLGSFGCLVAVIGRKARQEGRARLLVEVLLGAAIVLLVVGGTVTAASLRQDAAARRAAVEGFEQRAGHALVEAWDVFRDGSCAVVWVHYEGEPQLAELTAVIVTRTHGAWRLRAISHETGDADNFYDESDCLEHADDA